MVKISVVMPVYNAEDYLEMSLKSVSNQEIKDIELICVNDGSTDNSTNIINKFAKDNDFIKVINQENSGTACARNNGIKNAAGEYIAFLDADDIFLDNTALEKMYELAKKTDAEIVGANLKRIKPDGSLEENYDYINAPFTYFDEQKVITPKEYGIPWAFYKNIYKKGFIEKHSIEFPQLSRGQDPIFLSEVLSKVERIPVIDVDLYGYNHSAGGGVNIKVNDYPKKRDYVQHFIQTFEILENNGFTEALDVYKKEFIDYINFRQNINDEDIQKILRESTELESYFTMDDYGYLIIDLIKNPPQQTDTEYETIKRCLFEESMLENTFIDIYRLKEYSKISEKSAIDENMLKSSFKQLKDIEEYTFEDKRKINSTVGKLQKQIKHYIKSNDEILTSNSWKVTGALRSLKHKF